MPPEGSRAGVARSNAASQQTQHGLSLRTSPRRWPTEARRRTTAPRKGPAASKARCCQKVRSRASSLACSSPSRGATTTVTLAGVGGVDPLAGRPAFPTSRHLARRIAVAPGVGSSVTAPHHGDVAQLPGGEPRQLGGSGYRHPRLHQRVDRHPRRQIRCGKAGGSTLLITAGHRQKGSTAPRSEGCGERISRKQLPRN